MRGRTKYTKTDLGRLRDALEAAYGARNIECDHIVNGQTYDFMVREPFVLVEYHGIQHYCDLPTMRGQYDFAAMQNEDEQKKRYCAERNIPLVIFDSSEKNFLLPEYVKYRLAHMLGEDSWFGER